MIIALNASAEWNKISPENTAYISCISNPASLSRMPSLSGLIELHDKNGGGNIAPRHFTNKPRKIGATKEMSLHEFFPPIG